MVQYTSPDGKWKIIIQDSKIKWIKLTEQSGQFTIDEIVKATKNIKPELWKE